MTPSLQFPATRLAALDRLEAFTPRMGGAYAAKRNYDLGAGAHDHVSGLSPYLRHRMISEKEAVAKALKAHGRSGAEKFIDEVFWRTYWKGWLEQRPDVFADYEHAVTADLGRVDSNSGLQKAYRAAVEGRTGIDCFDAWAAELVSTGYLHNHARMWFASIWIFTLKLPWALGADFFLYHLLDGDPASNTLSWRWVAGLQTQGKTYAARAPNIEKYTGGRFNPVGQLADFADPLPFTPYDRAPLPTGDTVPAGADTLIITDDCLDPFAHLPAGFSPKTIHILDTRAVRTRRGASPLVQEFLGAAMEDAVARLAKDGASVSVDTPDSLSLLQSASTVLIHAPVGPNAAALTLVADQLQAQGTRVVRFIPAWDQAAWPHAKKGFFVFKKQINTLIAEAFDDAAKAQMGFDFDG